MNPIWLNAVRASGGAIPTMYLFRDQFTTDEAAPLASPRTAEPGPGTLTITDSAGDASISGGALVWSNNSVNGQPLVESGLFSHAAGRVIAYRSLVSSGNRELTGGLGVYRCESVQGFYYTQSGPAITSGVITAGSGKTRDIYFVMRSGGGSFFVWRDIIEATAVLGYVNAAGLQDGGVALRPVGVSNTLSVSAMAVVDTLGVWSQRYTIATNRIATTSAGSTTASEANAIIEHTITAATSVTQELDVRRTDADNRWIVRMNQADSTIRLIERNAGIETERSSAAQTWTNGSAYRIVVIQDGNAIRVFVDDVIKNTFLSATFNNTATSVRVSYAGSDLVAWPRVISGADLAELNEV